MSIRIKDFIVGKQKEKGMRGAEAYAYARQMQAIRESNPFATEKVVKPIINLLAYVLVYGALGAMLCDSMGWGIILTVVGLTVGIYGKITAVEVPIQR